MALSCILSSQWIVSILMLLGYASSFSIRAGHRTVTNQGLETRMRATIIGYDEESDSYKSTFDSPILEEDDDTRLTFTSIVDSLEHSMDQKDSLLRLAVAFSPPDQTVRMEDVSQIHIIDVDNDHIEISAVVCDESECVTLLVPVTFPHECGVYESTEECVLENIGELDVEAQHVLKKRAVECQETTDEEKELLAALHNDNDIHLPSWWIAPDTSEMSEECQSIKRILNQEDFQMQLQGLANLGLDFCEDGDLFDIQRVTVCSIGPAGFYFRAIAKEGNSCTILDIPYSAFLNNADDGNIITEPSSLRSAVLGAVASICQ